MNLTIKDCVCKLIESSTPVLNLYELRDDIWYRNTKGPRYGPWLSARYKVLDNSLWKRKSPCLYFVTSESGLKYVGISNKKLEERWRTSPAHDKDGNPLNREELFHSQCWPSICEEYARFGIDQYGVSVLHGEELLDVLSSLQHPISNLSALEGDGDVAVTAIEAWIIKHMFEDLWNKRK